MSWRHWVVFHIVYVEHSKWPQQLNSRRELTSSTSRGTREHQAFIYLFFSRGAVNIASWNRDLICLCPKSNPWFASRTVLSVRHILTCYSLMEYQNMMNGARWDMINASLLLSDNTHQEPFWFLLNVKVTVILTFITDDTGLSSSISREVYVTYLKDFLLSMKCLPLLCAWLYSFVMQLFFLNFRSSSGTIVASLKS